VKYRVNPNSIAFSFVIVSIVLFITTINTTIKENIMPSFGKRSKERLSSCHPDLQELLNSVITVQDCTIICGHRGMAEQQAAYDSKNSTVQFPNSKHNSCPSMAVDIAPWPLDWDDIQGFKDLAETVKDCAKQLDIEIVWGGDWKTFKDYPHYQLKKA